MALTAPFDIEIGDRRASQSRNSKSYAIAFAFMLGMMVATIGLLTVQHYGLGDDYFMKFFFAPALPTVQPLLGATGTSVGVQVSNNKGYDLGGAAPASIHLPIPPSLFQQMAISFPAVLPMPLVRSIKAFNKGLKRRGEIISNRRTGRVRGRQQGSCVNCSAAELAMVAQHVLLLAFPFLLTIIGGFIFQQWRQNEGRGHLHVVGDDGRDEEDLFVPATASSPPLRMGRGWLWHVPKHLRRCQVVAGLNRRQRRQHLQPPGTPPPPPAGPPTSLTPAELAGVVEDHAYEQYFFDEATRSALLALVRQYERPLLLCTPSLAVAAEEAGLAYLLLDRDERFSFLSGFRHFELDAPTPLTDYPFDAVFCDPPFANFGLAQLRGTLRQITPPSANGIQSALPLYIAYNSRREDSLLEEFSEQGLERVCRLGYCSVKPETQQHIFLYGPRG